MKNKGMKWIGMILTAMVISLTSVNALEENKQDKSKPEFKYGGPMITIPAGKFMMGSDYEKDNPANEVYLSEYKIGKYEVTRGEYRKFIDAGGYSKQEYWSEDGWKWKQDEKITKPNYWEARFWLDDKWITQTDKHPVVGVIYYEAEAYCKWAGGRLPTEAEWEKAASWDGSKHREFPWGDTWNTEYCNNYYDTNPDGKFTVPVGSYPKGNSYYSCSDMAGNVFEWCKDWFSVDYTVKTPSEGWNNPQGPSTGIYRVLRGGSWGNYSPNGGVFRCAYRNGDSPSNQNSIVGFRVAR